MKKHPHFGHFMLVIVLWCSVTFAYAEEETEHHPTLVLHQAAHPAQMLILPHRRSDEEGAAEIGTLFSSYSLDEEKPAYIDFFISGIRADIPMNIYLAFSTRPSDREARAGQLGVDPQSMEILAGVHMHPLRSLVDDDSVFKRKLGTQSILGETAIHTQTAILSVKLSDLAAPQLQGNELYFQAIAIPSFDGQHNDEPRAATQTSEIDFYQIDRTALDILQAQED